MEKKVPVGAVPPELLWEWQRKRRPNLGVNGHLLLGMGFYHTLESPASLTVSYGTMLPVCGSNTIPATSCLGAIGIVPLRPRGLMVLGSVTHQDLFPALLVHVFAGNLNCLLSCFTLVLGLFSCVCGCSASSAEGGSLKEQLVEPCYSSEQMDRSRLYPFVWALLLLVPLAEIHARNLRNCTTADAEVAALRMLYRATNGETWSRADGWLQGDPCQAGAWFGITCNDRCTITSISLKLNHLTGTLPPLGALTSLVTLDLPENTISGTLPSFDGNEKLTTLDVRRNRLIDDVDFEALGRSCPDLNVIDLGDNYLTGSVVVKGWSKLSRLRLARNRFISLDLEQLPQLANLIVSTNRFSGTLPQLRQFPKLVVLRVNANEFSGPFPSVEGLNSLNQIYAGSNRFSGTLPELTGSFPDFKAYHFSDNLFTGTIPALSVHSGKFTKIILGRNQINGTVPSSIAALPLTYFDIGNNLIEEFPRMVFGFRNLEYLYLNDNPFPPQPFPTDFGALKKLKMLHLDGIGLRGSIPEQLGNLKYLEALLISNNEITSIDAVTLNSTTGGLLRLKQLVANNNALSRLPIFRDDSGMKVIRLANNLLSGTFPTEYLDKMSEISVIDVRDNSIEGLLPQNPNLSNHGAQLQELSFSGNELLFSSAQPNALPRWLQTGSDRSLSYDSRGFPYTCPNLLLSDNPYATVRASRWQTPNCTCVTGYFGDPNIICTECPCGGTCTHSTVRWAVGSFPVFTDNGDEPHSLEGFIDCLPTGSCNSDLRTCPCNPFGTCELQMDPSCTFQDSNQTCSLSLVTGSCGTESDSICDTGRNGRLCSRCKRSGDGEEHPSEQGDYCYYPVGEQCVSIDSTDSRSAWITVGFQTIVLFLNCAFNSGAAGSRSGHRLGLSFFVQVSTTVNAPLLSVGLASFMSVASSIFGGGSAPAINGDDAPSSSLVDLYSKQIRCWSDSFTDFNRFWFSLVQPLLVLIPGALLIALIRYPIERWLSTTDDAKNADDPTLSMPLVLDSYDHGLGVLGDDDEDELEVSYNEITKITSIAWRLLGAVVFLLYNVSYNAMTSALSIFNCKDESTCSETPTLYTGSSFVENRPWLRCGSPEYYAYAWTSTIAIVFYAFCVPLVMLGIFVVFHKPIRERTKHHIHQWFGFMYIGHKKRYWWFGVVALFRRFILALIVGLMNETDTLRTTFVLLLFLTSILIHHLCQPFETFQENILEFSALLLFTGSFAVQQALWTPFDHQDAAMWVFSALNAIVFCIYLLLYLLENWQEWSPYLRPAWTWLRSCLPKREG